MDVAVNSRGEKIFMIAQSYMPAQEIHILNNPSDRDLSPWYSTKSAEILTPEWAFRSNQLKKW